VIQSLRFFYLVSLSLLSTGDQFHFLLSKHYNDVPVSIGDQLRFLFLIIYVVV
jgi:hypothetical protein